MNDIKINLSLILPGGVLLSKQECLKNPKDSYERFKLTVQDEHKKRETLNIACRKTRTIRQNIKLTREAYDYMINPKACFDLKLNKIWKKMSNKERIKHHCKAIAESLGAVDFSFEILPD